MFGRQKDFRSSHPDNQRTLARLLNAAMCPVTVPEEGVVLVCSGSAQIAKLHTTKIKKRRGKQTTNRHTHEENRWMDRRQRETACIHCMCVLNSIRMKTSTIDHERFFFFVCVYVTFYSSFQLFFCLFFLLLLPRYSAANQTILFPFFPNRRTHYPDRDEPAHRHAIGIQLSFCDGDPGDRCCFCYIISTYYIVFCL